MNTVYDGKFSQSQSIQTQTEFAVVYKQPQQKIYKSFEKTKIIV